jgi:hypothetical protein
LEEMVTALTDEKDIVKGLEVKSTSWDISNLAIHRSVFREYPFDNSFGWAADTELLARLKSLGDQLISPSQASLIHLQKSTTRHYFRRAFRYGMYWARLQHRYAAPVEIDNVGYAGKVFLVALFNLLGLLIGFVVYWPERRRRKQA